MFAEVDEDGSGEIDLAEFVEFMTCIKARSARAAPRGRAAAAAR